MTHQMLCELLQLQHSMVATDPAKVLLDQQFASMTTRPNMHSTMPAIDEFDDRHPYELQMQFKAIFHARILFWLIWLWFTLNNVYFLKICLHKKFNKNFNKKSKWWVVHSVLDELQTFYKIKKKIKGKLNLLGVYPLFRNAKNRFCYQAQRARTDGRTKKIRCPMPPRTQINSTKLFLVKFVRTDLGVRTKNEFRPSVRAASLDRQTTFCPLPPLIKRATFEVMKWACMLF